MSSPCCSHSQVLFSMSVNISVRTRRVGPRITTSMSDGDGSESESETVAFTG
jgi:hypothetical protein